MKVEISLESLDMLLRLAKLGVISVARFEVTRTTMALDELEGVYIRARAKSISPRESQIVAYRCSGCGLQVHTSAPLKSRTHMCPNNTNPEWVPVTGEDG